MIYRKKGCIGSLFIKVNIKLSKVLYIPSVHLLQPLLVVEEVYVFDKKAHNLFFLLGGDLWDSQQSRYVPIIDPEEM